MENLIKLLKLKFGFELRQKGHFIFFYLKKEKRKSGIRESSSSFLWADSPALSPHVFISVTLSLSHSISICELHRRTLMKTLSHWHVVDTIKVECVAQLMKCTIDLEVLRTAAFLGHLWFKPRITQFSAELRCHVSFTIAQFWPLRIETPTSDFSFVLLDRRCNLIYTIEVAWVSFCEKLWNS